MATVDNYIHRAYENVLRALAAMPNECGGSDPTHSARLSTKLYAVSAKLIELENEHFDAMQQ